MSFTFVVETGAVTTGANSYVSVEAADDIVAVELDKAPKWDALTEDEKQKRLVAATMWLDDRMIWNGKRVTDPVYPEKKPAANPQPLGWPRRHAHDREGLQISEVVVPVEVQRATALLALHVLTEGEIDPAEGGVQRFRADTFEIEYQRGFYRPANPSFLRFILNGLGQIGNEAGFKKIVKV